MDYVEKIYGAGDDALGYEYEITVSPLGALTSLLPDLTGLTLRTTNVNIPSNERGEYQYDYKTRTIVKPNGKVTTPNEFDFDFRVDKNYAFYNFFIAWQNVIANNEGASGDFLSGGSPIRADIVVKSVDANGDLTGGIWNFKGCWPKVVGSLGLDAQSGDPITCNINLAYLTQAHTA